MFLHTRASRVFARDGITVLEERTTLTSSLILLLKPMANGGWLQEVLNRRRGALRWDEKHNDLSPIARIY